MEKYTRVFHFDSELYIEGSPIVICAGAILKENLNGNIIGQLKFKSISNKNIKAIKVELLLFDASNKAQEETVKYQYLDLNVSRNEEFGSNQPIAMPYNDTRFFSVVVKEVLFSDGSIWKSNSKVWEELPKLKTLESEFEDSELVKQYKINTLSSSKYVLNKTKDLWFCACGNINHENEEKCFVCESSQNELRKKLNKENLTKDKDERIKQNIESRNQKEQKLKKMIIIGIIVFVVLLGYISIKKQIEKEKDYNVAMSKYEEKKYFDAMSYFGKLKNYKNSEEKFVESKYGYAQKMIEEKKYELALKYLETIRTYKDSKSLMKKCETFIAINNFLADGSHDYFDNHLGDYHQLTEEEIRTTIIGQTWTRVMGGKGWGSKYKYNVTYYKDGTYVSGHYNPNNSYRWIIVDNVLKGGNVESIAKNGIYLDRDLIYDIGEGFYIMKKHEAYGGGIYLDLLTKKEE